MGLVMPEIRQSSQSSHGWPTLKEQNEAPFPTRTVIKIKIN